MDIISIIAGLLKDTKSLIEFEEQLKLLMQKAFTQWVGEIFEELDKIIKQEKLEEGWVYCRSDNRNIQFLFGSVTFKRSLMHDKRGNSHYPLDEWLGLVPHQRYSPLVELKVAELASENTYREVADILKEWTAVSLSHTTVGNMVKHVGKTQAEADKAESNQRHISFRMKKRGMHWSELGAEAMVKIKQGILNGTLREAYLKHRSRSERKQRNLKQSIRMSQLLKQPVRPSVGVKHGSVALHSSSSSAMGHLSKILELSF
ncbi:UPF0236 family transposase-like protein [Heyndrickxia coagulans]|uniref:UPF0236 family transposase-like protein n=1 Tax=Heyndrickxia coagulans TaxID=1398 RepID=UPI000DF442A4|nr:UPF0236 family protein [Heyndrickxia coagulans]RCS34177.1 hypothetical protein DN050_14070 [Heyndrickxia coagulans]